MALSLSDSDDDISKFTEESAPRRAVTPFQGVISLAFVTSAGEAEEAGHPSSPVRLLDSPLFSKFSLCPDLPAMSPFGESPEHFTFDNACPAEIAELPCSVRHALFDRAPHSPCAHTQSTGAGDGATLHGLGATPTTVSSFLTPSLAPRGAVGTGAAPSTALPEQPLSWSCQKQNALDSLDRLEEQLPRACGLPRGAAAFGGAGATQAGIAREHTAAHSC